MGDIFKHFIELIKDKTTSWGFKTALFISVITLVFATDYYLGFSYNYHLNNKIGQLEKINRLKSNYRTDSISLIALSNMEQKVLSKKHYSDRIYLLFQKDSLNSKTNETSDTPEPKGSIETNSTQRTDRSIFWMAFSANYLFAIILPFLIFLPLYSKDGRKANAIVGWFASLIMICIIGGIATWVSYQIPLILNNPIWNYVLNFIIHTLFWIVVIKIGKDKNKN